MSKKNIKNNIRRIKAKRCYSFKEISEILNIHIGTVQGWRKQGLIIIDETSKPYLVIGSDLKEFISKRGSKRKCILRAGEFYCMTCKMARRSLLDRLCIEITGKKLGKTTKQAFIKGVCEICKRPLLLFSSEEKAKKWQESYLFLQEHTTNLIGNDNSSLNTDIIRGANNES